MPLDTARLPAAVDTLAPVLRDVSARIHQNPELRYEEHKAAAWISAAVEAMMAVLEMKLRIGVSPVVLMR